MNQVTPFQFNDHAVRTISVANEPWFVAKDVADALDYNWKGAQTIRHVPDEWRGVYSVVTPSGTQEMVTLSEAGLFFFVNRSDKPKALSFQKWVAGEVLPAIRRTGSYTAPQAKPAPLTVPWVEHMALAEQAGELRDEVESLKEEVLELYRAKMPRHRIETKTIEKIPVAALELMLRYGIPRDEIAAVDSRSRVCLRQHIFLMRKNGVLGDEVEVQDVH